MNPCIRSFLCSVLRLMPKSCAAAFWFPSHFFIAHVKSGRSAADTIISYKGSPRVPSKSRT